MTFSFKTSECTDGSTQTQSARSGRSFLVGSTVTTQCSDSVCTSAVQIAPNSQTHNSRCGCVHFACGSGVKFIHDMVCGTIPANRSYVCCVGRALGRFQAGCPAPYIPGFFLLCLKCHKLFRLHSLLIFGPAFHLFRPPHQTKLGCNWVQQCFW